MRLGFTSPLTQIVALALGLAIVCVSAPGRADDGGQELRLKLKFDGRLTEIGGHPLRLFAQGEQRFRDGGLSLLKHSVGVATSLRPWLGVQSYYAHVDKYGGAHKTKHLLVFDLELKVHLGPITLTDRHSNEWHSEPGFYRYRNLLVVSASPGVRWMRLWFGDELRADWDEGRVVMNDLLAGVDFKLSRALKLRLYYDHESKRRGADTWTNTDVFQLQLVSHLGG